MSLVAVYKCDVFGKTFIFDNAALQQIFSRIHLLKCRYLGSFPSENVPTSDKNAFANVNMQLSNLKGQPEIVVANSCHKVYCADFLGREMCIFFK